MLIAQLTDTHVVNPATDTERPVDHNGRLASAVASLNAERPLPDLVLATGDLTNDARQDQMDELVHLLEPLEIPLLVLPGNHDDRTQMRAAFDMPWAAENHLSWVVELDGLRLVGLDTIVPRQGHGDLDAEREAWLRQALASTAGHPTAIAMHHPPFASGIGWMDTMMLRRADVFAEIVRANPHVERVFCGHLHRPIQAVVGGVTTTSGLSTVEHIALNLAADAPIQAICDPAGYQLHLFDGTTWVSHTRYIDTDAAPFTV